MVRGQSRLQAGALLLLAGLLLHHVSYEAAYGHLTHAELHHTGHGYMSFVSPLIAGLAVFAAWRWGERLREARRTGHAPHGRSSFVGVWLSASVVLAAAYVLQEWVEAWISPGHGFDIPGARVHDGLWLPLLVLTLGAVIAVLLRIGERAVVWAARSARMHVQRARKARGRALPAGFRRRLRLLAGRVGGRAPPGALQTLRKLRPAKIRSALRRRWFERRMVRQEYAPRTDVADVGTEYGGWIVPLTLLEPGWTCYSIGAGGDISFDTELAGRYGLRVRCVEPVQDYVDLARATANGQPDLVVYRAALALEDGPIRMQRTHVANSNSVSSAHLYDTDEWVEVPGRTLQSLMSELGDTRVDLLKVDMEGAEYDWLRQIDLAALGVKVLCIQMHHNASVRAARRAIADLRAAGFRPVGCRPVVKLTFVSDAAAA